MHRTHGNIAVRRNHIGKPRIIVEGKSIFRVQGLDVIALEQVSPAPVRKSDRREDGKSSALRAAIPVRKQQTACSGQSPEPFQLFRRQNNGETVIHIAGSVFKNKGGKVACV